MLRTTSTLYIDKKRRMVNENRPVLHKNYSSFHDVLEVVVVVVSNNRTLGILLRKLKRSHGVRRKRLDRQTGNMWR